MSSKGQITQKALEKARSTLKSAFSISIIIGLLIILGFLSTDNDKYSFWLILIPIVGYIIYGNQIATKYRYLPDFGDSVYYLGFIFTLMSLLGATIFEKLSADPSKTISYFGMALSTTILGLIYRTYHSQFTDVNSDPIDKAKEELANELSKFKNGLNEIMLRTSDTLKVFEKDIPEALSASLVNLSYSFNKIDQELGEVESTHRKINEKISSTYSEICQKAAESSIGLIETFENLNSNVKYKSSAINKELSNSVKVLKVFNKNTNVFIDNITGTNSINGSLGQLSDSLNHSVGQINEFSEKVVDCTGNYSKAVGSMDDLNKNVKKQVKIINSIFNEANKVIEKKLS